MQDHSLEGKTAIVFGASRGIGAATAALLAARGARVMLAARNAQDLAGVVAAIRQAGGTAEFVVADMGQPDTLASAVAGTVEAFGGLDIAVNNAGLGQAVSRFHETPLEVFDQSTETNFRGVVAAMQEEVKTMLETGGGSIVNVGSVSSLRGSSGVVAYSATKHALLGLTRSVALEYAAKGIRANLVAPGLTGTDMFLKGFDERRKAAYEAMVPMRRIARPEEIAEAIWWLASDSSSYVTGSVLSIDGGMTA